MGDTCDITQSPPRSQEVVFQPRAGPAEPTKPELRGCRAQAIWALPVVDDMPPPTTTVGSHANPSYPPLLTGRPRDPDMRRGSGGGGCPHQATRCLLRVRAPLRAACPWMGPMAPGLLLGFSGSA